MSNLEAVAEKPLMYLLFKIQILIESLKKLLEN